MTDELVGELMIALAGYGIDDDSIRQKIIIVCSNYEIQKKETELSIYTCEDYNMEILKRYLISKTVKGLTDRTLKYYRTQLIYILDRVQKPIDSITADDLKLYLAKRQINDKVSSRSVGNEWRILSAFFGWLHREEIITKNPMFKVERPKERKVKKKAFTNMECERIRNGCKQLRDRAIVEVLLSTWCRVSEVEQMDINDIEGDEITVIGKGKKERTVYLNSKAQLAIQNYLESRVDDKPYLFCSYDKPYERLGTSSIEKMLRELGRELKIDNVHPHRFRRTGATLALRGGMPIEKVSYLLGHESIETTQIYLDTNEDEAKAAHKKYVV